MFTGPWVPGATGAPGSGAHGPQAQKRRPPGPKLKAVHGSQAQRALGQRRTEEWGAVPKMGPHGPMAGSGLFKVLCSPNEDF